MSKDKFIEITTNDPDVIHKIKSQGMWGDAGVNVFGDAYIATSWELLGNSTIRAILIKSEE